MCTQCMQEEIPVGDWGMIMPQFMLKICRFMVVSATS